VKKILYSWLILQVIVFSAAYFHHARALEGEGYLLETRPVDPRDLFRGDYIILSYPVERVREDTPCPDNLHHNQQVYAVWEPEGDFWALRSVHEQRPTETSGPVVTARWQGGDLDYGIGRYYVPEGQGEPDGAITVEVVLNRQGRAQIRKLYLDDRPFP